MRAPTSEDRAWLVRMRAEELAAGWDWSGRSDEELWTSSVGFQYRRRYAFENLGRALDQAFLEPIRRLLPR